MRKCGLMIHCSIVHEKNPPNLTISIPWGIVPSVQNRGCKFEKNQDIGELPAFSVTEAAHYLLIPRATLHSWAVGRYYQTETGQRFFKPIIDLPDKDHGLLSFVNLVEVHMLDALRRIHEIPLAKVRIALNYIKAEFDSPHPLAEHRFETDGLDLFIEKYGQLINVSQAGQLAIKNCFKLTSGASNTIPAAMP